MLDSDLAELYGVTTFNLNKAVKRNAERFPQDFMFQLTAQEFASLIFQTGISKVGRGGRRHFPLRIHRTGRRHALVRAPERRAIKVNVAIMRTFVRLRQLLASNADLARKLNELEQKYDAQFRVVFEAIRKLMEPPPDPPGEPIGFRPRKPASSPIEAGKTTDLDVSLADG
jgi:hypothetical protein